ncbi:MAG: ABC transporter permease [Mariniphaga sp.]
MKFKGFRQRLSRSALIRVIQRELFKISGNWVLLFTTLLGPVAVFLLVSWIFSSAVVRDLPVTVVDLDHTQFSRKIVRIIDAVPATGIVWQSVSLEEARAQMVKGRTDAVICIPEGLEKSVQRGIQAEIAMYVNNTNVIKGGVIKSQLMNTFATLSGAVKVQTMIRKGIPAEEAVKKAQPIKSDIHLLFNPYGNYAYFLMMGLLPLLAVVFIFLGTSYAVGIEMKDGTVHEWLELAGGSSMVAMIGKLIPYLFLFFADLMAMNLILIKVMGTPLNGSFPVILASELLLILAYQAMAILLLTITINLRLTLSLGSAYTMMALTFSGLTFPAMGMPVIAKMFSFVFPYTFWLKIFLSQSLRGEPVHETIPSLLLLVLFILTGIIGFPLFKKRMKDERWRNKE